MLNEMASNFVSLINYGIYDMSMITYANGSGPSGAQGQWSS